MAVARGPEPNDGIPVDKSGGPTIDPTKNVLDLVRAESKYQDAMREMLREFEDGMRKAAQDVTDSKLKLQDWMRDAESKRIDQLAALREGYDKRIADMLRDSVQSTSSLVSTQLVQIQATFDARVSKLEQFRWESGGRSSVSDPALADALARMGDGLSALKGSDSRGTGRGEITGPMWAFVGAVIIVIIGAIAAVVLESSKSAPLPAPPVIYAPAAPVGVKP